jgi:hypothetical protein
MWFAILIAGYVADNACILEVARRTEASTTVNGQHDDILLWAATFASRVAPE